VPQLPGLPTLGASACDFRTGMPHTTRQQTWLRRHARQPPPKLRRHMTFLTIENYIDIEPSTFILYSHILLQFSQISASDID